MKIRCLECGSGSVTASNVFPELVLTYWCNRCGKKWWIVPEKELTPGQISRMERMFGERVTEHERAGGNESKDPMKGV